MISPSVLWMEEIDKAFAGFADEAGTDATMARIVGRFLTWLQEHTDPVFVVATANNVSGLPPELLRRGRFDEMFFVDLRTTTNDRRFSKFTCRNGAGNRRNSTSTNCRR